MSLVSDHIKDGRKLQGNLIRVASVTHDYN